MHFIGTFAATEQLTILDPGCYRLISEKYIDYTDEPLEYNTYPGTWYAFHHYGNYNHPVALILMREEYFTSKDIHFVSLNEMHPIGEIISINGRMIACVDKSMINNTLFTYITNAEAVLYRIRDVKNWAKKNPDSISQKLWYALSSLESDHQDYIDGTNLLSLCNEERIPIMTDLWANDCYYRLQNNPLHASPIMGGIISRTYSDFNPCFANDNESIIYVDLDTNATKNERFKVIRS